MSIVDTLSKWVIFEPGISFDAEAAAEVLYRRVICEYGTPETVIADRDARWLSDFFQAFVKR